MGDLLLGSPHARRVGADQCGNFWSSMVIFVNVSLSPVVGVKWGGIFVYGMGIEIADIFSRWRITFTGDFPTALFPSGPIFDHRHDYIGSAVSVGRIAVGYATDE